jgi:phosphinothricin acetyltransferase
VTERSSDFPIRDAGPDDATACQAIYAPYVRDTAISFEAEAPSVPEMAERIADARRRHAWVVLEDDGRVVGYAYAVPFIARAAYQWTCSVTVYLEAGRRRSGAGRALYEALFDRLVSRGLRSAIAIIALPNDPSIGLHRALGFEPVGTFRRAGWKLGRWHDVAWYQRALVDDDSPPQPLR